MNRTLIIPHSCDPHVSVRLREIAFGLAGKTEVYLLNWHEPKNSSWIARAHATIQDAFATHTTSQFRGLKEAGIPFLHRPLWLLPQVNAASLAKLISRERIDTVIQGLNYFFFLPDKKSCTCRHILDFNDLPSDDPGTAGIMARFIAHAASQAEEITCCSKGLADFIGKRYAAQAHVIPNGCNLARLQNVTAERIQQIRGELGMEGSFVLGYIGKVGEWIDTEFLVRFLRRARSRMPQITLLIVGDIPEKQRTALCKEPGITCTGGVTPEQAAGYFSSIDLGVLPGKRSSFQDMAFHGKLIEYTAARKQVIATDQEGIRSLGFPSISCVPLEEEAWEQALEQRMATPWEPAWDMLASGYDWERISGQFLGLISKKQ